MYLFVEFKPTPCDSSPCKNGGVCSNEGETFLCECEGDHEGKTCEIGTWLKGKSLIFFFFSSIEKIMFVLTGYIVYITI